MLVFVLILSIINLIALAGSFIFFLRIWNKNMNEINKFSGVTKQRIDVLEIKLKPYESLENI